MSCFSCFNPKDDSPNSQNRSKSQSPRWPSSPSVTGGSSKSRTSSKSGTGSSSSQAHEPAITFTFKELATATKNFSSTQLLGEGGFGRVYKGKLKKTGQLVAIKHLDPEKQQGTPEFVSEVLTLSLCHHPHLVRLVGYCVDENQRAIVYEFMQQGSLESHLHIRKPGTAPLEWSTRMKIAEGAAKGLEYLHNQLDPQIIHRDVKPSNILLDVEFNAKLSDFGMAKLGPTGDKTHVSTRVIGTYGYCAPEYAMTGQLTKRSDVYSFGVVLLELITGRKVIDPDRPRDERSLIPWAKKLFWDRRYLRFLKDPLLERRLPKRALQQAVGVASMCLQDNSASRPVIADVAAALSYLSAQCSTKDNDSKGVKFEDGGGSSKKGKQKKSGEEGRKSESPRLDKEILIAEAKKLEKESK